MKKFAELTTVISFCTLIAILAAAFLIIPDREFSQQENRNLATLPKADSEKFFSGEFAEEINTYFADQFPFRDMFVKLKSAAELAFLKGENNGVLYSQNQLAVKDFNAYESILNITEDTDRIYPETVSAQLKNIETLGENLQIPLVTVIPPRTIDISDSVFDYDRPDGDLVFNLMDENLGEESGYIDILDSFREKYKNGEYIYYRTDHHWTTLGAYYTYCEIMKALGKETSVIPKEAFTIEEISEFSGTTAARGNFPIYEKDIIEIWHLEDDEQYEIIADGEILEGFYEKSYLETSDKYSVFLDGTHNLTTITKTGDDRETLLVVKDSFANCLIPFLAGEYNIVAVNIHTVNAISAMAENYEADAVLLVCNTENLITTGDLGKLR